MNPILRSLALIVGVPTFVAMIYYGFIASNIYVSESKFAVRSAQGTTSLGGLGALLSSSSLPSSGQDATVVVEFTRSLDMLRRLAERVDLVSHYSDSSVDFLARLPSNPDQSQVLDYLKDRIRIDRDSLNDVITLQVRAFDAQTARDINREIIALNEVLVNDLSARIEQDAMQTARDELKIAVDRVRSTAQDINRFQRQNDSVSPSDESVALFGRVSAIESRLSETQAELSELLTFMREDSADVVSAKNRIEALRKQLAVEKGRITDGGDSSLGKLVESYQPLVLEQEIAQQQYASALAALEAARADAQRQKQYLVTFVQPSLPDVSVEPHRLFGVLTVMIFSFLAYLIGGLLWSALRDHLGH